MPGSSAAAYVACVPHLPFITLQARELNEPFWAAYEARAAELRDFDPELVFVFGSDHYEGQLMRAMPTFMIGYAAEAVDDSGGFPGRLVVAADSARACAEYLVREEFDVAVSHAMTVDHGFSNVLRYMLGAIDAKPVVPIFVNALAHPRPGFRRCRRFGAAVGRFAAGLGKRVAFLGSGGLSHETGEIFPQVHELPEGPLREFLIHGMSETMSRARWRANLKAGLKEVNTLLEQRVPGVGQVRKEWDQEFLRTLASSRDLSAFDDWQDEAVLRAGGNGAGEVREWIAACAAAQAAGVSELRIDYYEAGTCIGVAAVVVHASSERDAP
jgi:2,3-dihydroxyphenylpropionate 1,2-dioxygenase